MEIEVAINQDIARRSVDVFVFGYTDGEFKIVKPTELEFVAASETSVNEPTFSFPKKEGLQFLRAFAEALVKEGLCNKEDVKEEIKAIKYHLEDMRKLAFRGKDG